MILLKDASILQGMPRVVAEKPQAQAFAYAFSRQMAQLLSLINSTRTWTALDSAPESVLDILASEMHVQGYSQSFPAARKRALVRGAFDYWAHAGTAQSVSNVLGDTFGGNAELQAWYEYGSSPGFFRINTDNPTISGEMLDAFIHLANAVKRLSAWLESVNVNITMPPAQQIHSVVLMRQAELNITTERIKIDLSVQSALATAGVVLTRFGEIVLKTLTADNPPVYVPVSLGAALPVAILSRQPVSSADF